MSWAEGGGDVKQKADRDGEGEGGVLKTGKNVRSSFIDDPFSTALTRNDNSLSSRLQQN